MLKSQIFAIVCLFACLLAACGDSINEYDENDNVSTVSDYGDPDVEGETSDKPEAKTEPEAGLGGSGGGEEDISGSGGVDEGEGGSGGGQAPAVCELVKTGHDITADATQPHFACSPKDSTCMLTYRVGTETFQNMYTMEGSRLRSNPMVHATRHSQSVYFVIGTQDGFLASTWELKSKHVENWLVRFDGSGAEQQAAKTWTDMSGTAQKAVSAVDGEWVASATWWHKGANYYFGRVDPQAEVEDAQEVVVPDVERNIIGGVAKIHDVVAMTSAWQNVQDQNCRLSLYLMKGSNEVSEIKLGPPVDNKKNPRSCPYYYETIGLYAVDGQFLVVWKDKPSNKSFAAMIKPDGEVVSITMLHPHLRDIVPLKDGYAITTHDQKSKEVSLIVLDGSWNEILTYTTQVKAKIGNSLGPIVATDGVNSQRLAMAWVEWSGVMQVEFFSFEGC